MNATTTVRQMIDEARDAILSDRVIDAGSASEMLVRLSALMGNVVLEINQRERSYNTKLLEILNESDTPHNKAEVVAKTSEEYYQYKLAKDYFVVLQEMIRSLKFRCKALAEEQRASGNL